MEKTQERNRLSSDVNRSSILRSKSDMNLTKALNGSINQAERIQQKNFIRQNTQDVSKTPMRTRPGSSGPKDPLKELDKIPTGQVGALPAE